MNQIGYVSNVDNGIAHLEVRRASACGDKCGSCGGGCSVPITKVKVKNTLRAEKGDLVEVKVQTRFILKSAFLVYIMPLIMMIAGIALGISVFQSIGIENYESLGFVVGLILLGVSFFILRVLDKKIKENNKIEFEMVKIIS